MLIEFSVKNFLSFKNKVTLSMEKGIGNELPENTFKIENVELLKTAAIYGANASGKSNLLKAFTCAIMMIRNSSITQIGRNWNLVKPFLFDSKSSKQPSEFEFLFITNGTKYRYFFSADGNKIYDEALDVYYTQKPTNIFKRTNTNQYEFKKDKSKLEILASRNTENKLFLSTATIWNYDKTKEPFLWLAYQIDIHKSLEYISNVDLIEYCHDEKNLKKFALKLLNEADMHIKDIHVDYVEDSIHEKNIEKLNSLSNYPETNIKIVLEHEVIEKNNVKKTYTLDFNNESSGTKILFAFAPFLKYAFENTRVILVDELEKSLHPLLVEFIIKLFQNKEINKANSQLIFTTHATNLFNFDLLRRDQIWFTEKDYETSISDLFPLDSFPVRKGENIEKGYRNGRYGAVPFIKEIDKWQEDLKK